jgi:signal transduction histidine kinase
MREVEGRPRRLDIGLALEEGQAVRVSVRDTGTGIAGDPATIFQPFFTTREDGMGMGLSICRSIVEAQGGRIVAANNPEYGATISFTLPIHESGGAHTSV